MKRLLLPVLLLSVLIVSSCGENEANKKVAEQEQEKELNRPVEYLKDKSAMEKVVEQIKEKGGPNLGVTWVVFHNDAYAFIRLDPDDASKLQEFTYSTKAGWNGPKVYDGYHVIGVSDPEEHRKARINGIEKERISFKDINLVVIPDYVQKFIDSAKHNGVTLTVDMVGVRIQRDNSSTGYFYSIDGRSEDHKTASMNIAKDGSVIDFEVRKLYNN